LGCDIGGSKAVELLRLVPLPVANLLVGNGLEPFRMALGEEGLKPGIGEINLLKLDGFFD